MARWYTKLKNWHTIWHIGMLSWNIGAPHGTFGMLVCKNKEFAQFWHVGTQLHWHANQGDTQARLHVNHDSTQARWRVDHVGTDTRLARDLANSSLRKSDMLISLFLQV